MLCPKRLCKLQWRRAGLYSLIFVYSFLMLFALLNKTHRVVYNMPYNLVQKSVPNICSIDIKKLGLVQLDMEPSTKHTEKLHRTVSLGGHWRPADCTPIQHVAIIIPHRNREAHLMLLLNRLHDLLQIQRLQYQIFVIDQAGTEAFNRGRLLNIGVVEALKANAGFDCFIFHDVDLIPEHNGNLYICDDQLRHLASAINEMRYHVMYNNYAGGVVAVNYHSLQAINGHSNDFWGWGSEDDDFSARSIGAGLLLTRPPEHIGRYKMVKHVKQWRTNNGYGIFLTWRARWKSDGLNNVKHKYKVLSVKQQHLYTNISVDLGPAQPLQYEHLPRESIFWFLWFFFP